MDAKGENGQGFYGETREKRAREETEERARTRKSLANVPKNRHSFSVGRKTIPVRFADFLAKPLVQDLQVRAA
jgi:hypothetical protein